jgi:predicted esterase
VVLMGLSQGCAASLISALLWEGEAFGGVVGMCGYLPFRKGMHDCIEDVEHADKDLLGGSGDGGDDVFERDTESSEASTRFERAVAWLCDELDVSRQGREKANVPCMQSIPVFLGHGTEDEKVPCGIGRLAAEFLRGVHVSVDWREYEGLGHWYSGDMLRDMTQFLKALKGWDNYDSCREQGSSPVCHSLKQPCSIS